MIQRRGKEYLAPWEQAFDRVLSQIEEFTHRQTTGGIVLMLCAVAALVLANSGWSEGYHKLLKVPMGLELGDLSLSMSLHHWINDGLMAIFFLVVGLELKRELIVGELSQIKHAMLPLIAAIGGMVLPAGIYIALNPSGHTFDGWGIPMATDIAFALGVLALLGRRVPRSLATFLVALAIVDDLGAVTVIALFYTEQLNLLALAYAGIIMGFLVSLNLGGVRRPLPYLMLGVLLWLAFLKSGVHATLAGVLLAFTVPIRPRFDMEHFIHQTGQLLNKMRKECQYGASSILHNSVLRSRVRALGEGVKLVQAPAQRLESKLHLTSAYLVIPIFALANAGVPVDFGSLDKIASHPVAMGIGLGLVVGKLLGIAGFTWVAVKLGISGLPEGMEMKHLIGLGLLGGIGFTMSIFIAELGFVRQPADLLMAKTGILFSSLIAGVSGFAWLYFTSGNNKGNA